MPSIVHLYRVQRYGISVYTVYRANSFEWMTMSMNSMRLKSWKTFVDVVAVVAEVQPAMKFYHHVGILYRLSKIHQILFVERKTPKK